MENERMTAERRAEIKKIAACVPFIDNGAGVAETQKAFVELLRELAAVEAERDEAREIIAKHDLCHNLHGRVDAEAFAQGCADEQRKHYGCAPHADRLSTLTAENERLREAIETVCPASEGFTEHFDTLVKLGVLVAVPADEQFRQEWDSDTMYVWAWRQAAVEAGKRGAA